MAIMQSFGKDGEIDKDKLIENLQDVDGIDPSTIPSDSDSDFPLTIVVDDYEVVIEENGDVHIEGEEGGNTNTTPGGNTSHGGNTNTGGDNGTGGGNTNINPGGNTNTGGDNGTGGGNTSGDGNETGENNGTGDTNTTNEIEIPDAETSGVIEVSGPMWSNGTASITISKGAGVDSSLKIQYKKADQGDDQYVTVSGNSEIISDLNDGEVIIVRLTDGKGNYGGIKTINIEDANKPTVVVNQGTVTETSIQITVNATDSESGIPSQATYKYYIKPSTEASYPSEPTATDGNAGYTFTNLDDNTSYDIKVEVVDRAGNTGSGESKGVKTLITIPNINDDGVINIAGPNWNGDGTADVTITKGDNVDDDLTIEYKKEEDDDYTPLGDGEKIEGLESGDKIYIHLTDGDRTSEDKVIEIKDETGPTVTVTQGATSTNGITVNVEVHDGESGVPETPTYNYYIKPSTEPDYPSEPTATDTNASHTFDNLEQGISYDIKVEVVDNAGNTGTGTLLGIQTSTVPSGETQGNIIWGNITWNQTNGTASVTVSKGTGVDNSLELQYQIVANGGAPTEEGYQTIANGGTIQDIANGSTVYARLYDGNNGGSPASIKIEDSTPPTVTVNKGTVTETSISITVNATDGESGIPSPASYRYYIKKNTDADYPTQPEATDGNAGYTFTGLDDNITYDIKVEVADNAGNTGSDELKGVKTLITIPAGDVEGAIKVEGPTWTEGKASISVSIGDDVDDSLYLEYKKGETGEYTSLEGDTIGDLVSGDTIYIHLTDGTRDGADKTVDILDTKSPNVTVTNGTITTNSITVNVVATDGESGMPSPASYKYYIAKADGGSFAEEPDGGSSESATHTFEGLEANVTYNIRVEVADIAGNNGTGTTIATTGTMPDAGAVGSLTWGGIVWNPDERTASTTISKGADVDESLQLQYQIVANSETQPVEGSYQIIDNGGTISGIKNGNVVYARLWDGKNGGKAASLEVRDTNPPTVNVTEGTVGETSISVNVSASDNEAGMPDTITYKYYIKKNEDSDYPAQPEDTNTTGSYTYEGLDDNIGYDMKVEADDYAGNTGAGELIGIRTLITIPEGNVEGAINVTDPVWSGGQATITVTKGENVDDSLYLEYRKGDSGEYTRLDGTAIGNLVNGDKIYIHLTDGTRDGTDKVITISDTTGPTVSVTKGTVTTNSITVNVNANDGESGMPAQPTYEYYIKESSTPTYPSTPDGGASTDASHTFTGLKQNVSYDIQVKTSDIAENPGTGTITIKTGTVPDAGDGQTGSIIWSNVNWNPSQGTASITVSKGAGVDESLQIQYQVVASGGSFSEDAYQTINNGGTISNLTHGSVVYARLWDGTNGGNPATQNIQDNVKPSTTIQFTENTADVDAQITATVTQTDDESGVASGKYIFNTNSGNVGEEETSYTGTISGNTVTVSASAEGTYYLHVLTIDRAGNKVETISGAVTVKKALPGNVEGMTQTDGNEGTGIVATDSKNNEWVWVEVPQSIYTTAKSDTDYTNIYNDMKTYTSSYSGSGYGYTDTYISNNGNFSSEMAYNNEKNRMLKSVYDNGGFWISRYEIGTTNASESVSYNINVTPVSQQNAYPIVNKTQPQSQQIVRKMNSQANLLFGIQWDLTLRFLQEKGGLSVSQLTIDSTSWGNYWNASFKIDRGKYQASWDSTSWTNATNVNKQSYDDWKLTTGAADRNCKMNIYDLAGNVWEWTLESDSSSYVVNRGGHGLGNGDYYPAGNRDNFYFSSTSDYYNNVGLRAALY